MILAIESSCDETSVALVRDGRVLSNRVSSQIRLHAEYGGVVPELATREHLRNLIPVARAALESAGARLEDLTAIAATRGPGLPAALLAGFTTASALAYSLGLPLYGIHHHEAHLYSPWIWGDPPEAHFSEFEPHVSLIVSGGHTLLVHVKGELEHSVLGGTLDDAAGECFDKSAKLLGLPQPGGPYLEALAKKCTDASAAIKRFDLPQPLAGRKGCDFSFSGLKTAIRECIDVLTSSAGTVTEDDAVQLSAALQYAIAQHVSSRCKRALESAAIKPTALVAAGGVASNGAVRTALEDVANKYGIPFMAPPSALCTDNGAMIAWAGIEHFIKGEVSPMDIPARPRWPLDEKVIKQTA